MENRNYEEITKEVQEIMEKKHPDVTVKPQTVIKNGVSCFGLSFCKEGERVSPTIYLRENSDAEEIVEVYENVPSKNDVDADDIIKTVTDKDTVLSIVLPRLYRYNESTKEEYFTVNYLDILVGFYIPVEGGAINVTNALIENLELNVTEVFEAAVSNMSNTVTIDTMDNILAGMLGDDYMAPEGGDQMFIMGNTKKYYGAAAILCKDKLNELCDKHGDMVILPSSVHETILIPYNENNCNIDDLADIVKNVNTTLAEVDLLSDSVYFLHDGEIFTIDECYEKEIMKKIS